MASLHTREIDVSIDETLGSGPRPGIPTEEWLRMVVDCALQVALPPEQSGQVGLLLTDDATVQELNRQYRGLDEVTDVLSFSTAHPGHWEGDMPDASVPHLQPLSLRERGDRDEGEGGVRVDDFVFPPNEGPPLGEVIISYPQACRQAKSRNETVEQELALLIIHGVLHLVGHDHLEAAEAAEMRSKEQAALETLFPIGTNS